MDITIRGNVVHVELSDFGWVGVVHSIGSFQAATLKDLIDLIKLVLERIQLWELLTVLKKLS